MSPPRPLESLVTLSAYHVVDEPDNYPSLDEVDALLLTGSKHTAADDIEWINKLVDYTRQAIETKRIKVVGVCFGHQVIARALGARLGRSEKGWEVAVTDVELTKEGIEVFDMPKMVSFRSVPICVLFKQFYVAFFLPLHTSLNLGR